MSRLYLEFGWQIPGQIATLRSFLTMCHDKEDSVLPREDTRLGVYFGGIGRGTAPCPPLVSPARVKARWHPAVVLKDRWGDEFLTHYDMCAQNRPSCQGLTAFILSVRVWLDRLAEMQMIISCSFFFLFFLDPRKPKVGSCLSIHGCKTGCLARL